jgi:hypothetical protein
VVDEHPRFHLDALRWYATLTAIAGVAPSDLIVHAVGRTSSDVLDFLRSRGVTVRGVDPFDARSPHCNKISGALRLAEDTLEGLAVLCDTDIAVLEDPRRIDVPAESVAGKVVDAPVPPLEVVFDIFAASGLTAPPTVPLPWGPDQWTVSGNNNGGLYLVPGPLLARVAPAWARWASWLLDRAELLREWSVYVDQVAMALALTDEGVTSLPLDVRWNTPIHDPTRLPTRPDPPAVIHYHQEVDRRGLIRSTGRASIDGRIHAVNQAIRDTWVQATPDATYKEWVAQSDSGHLRDDDGQAILATLMEAIEPATVLDVGADSGLNGDVSTGRYTSIAWSKDALRSLAEFGTEADVVLCLGELTYPTSTQRHRELVGLLWRSTRRALVVRGQEDPGHTPLPGMELLQPLSATLREVAPDAEIYPVKVDGSVTTFVVLRPPEGAHPRDFTPATLAPLIARHPDPLSLVVLRLHARRTTRFYPDHAPRLWEYPVVAQLVMASLPPGSRLVDVGAGVTPLAPFLTSRGYVVDTVDPSSTVRTWPPAPDWNEWDFLDYGAIGYANRSWNCTLEGVPPRPPFDGIYSISVIEHVPAKARRALLADISTRTRLGGLVVLTIDLVRGTELLWNLNLGVEVENLADHGSLRDVVDECAAVGLELFREEVVRDWGDSRVDIGLLALRQSKDPPTRTWRSTGRLMASLVRRSRP